MLLRDLIHPLPQKYVIGTANPNVDSLAFDSRNVHPGAMFMCIRGERFDGHNFIGDAIAAGACAILVDNPSCVDFHVPVVVVPDTRLAIPILAARFYNYPSRNLKLIGVTGTKGKTTTTYMIHSCLNAAGILGGVIGTLGAKIGDVLVPLDRTTPESVDLQGLLARMVREGVSAVAMEVSSHALAKNRTLGCEYDVGVFTNLTHDHLDFHGTIEEYLKTKLLLFSDYPNRSDKKFVAVINADNPSADCIRQATLGKVVTYGVHRPADLCAMDISVEATGVSFSLVVQNVKTPVSVPFGGVFNVYNALAAIGASVAIGVDIRNAVEGLQTARAVPGRFESVDCGQDFAVIVDYAHTPDSLDNVLRTARALTTGRLIVVFGCGGDRDKAKRPIMGGIASTQADICIVTTDNPRSEEPEAIIQEILAGTSGNPAQVESVLDRREAIKHALEIAQPGDLVLIAGKGHETYQIFKDRTIYFDDREVVREILTSFAAG